MERQTRFWSLSVRLQATHFMTAHRNTADREAVDDPSAKAVRYEIDGLGIVSVGRCQGEVIWQYDGVARIVLR
jgi:hypothetical protein